MKHGLNRKNLKSSSQSLITNRPRHISTWSLNLRAGILVTQISGTKTWTKFAWVKTWRYWSKFIGQGGAAGPPPMGPNGRHSMWALVWTSAQEPAPRTFWKKWIKLITSKNRERMIVYSWWITKQLQKYFSVDRGIYWIATICDNSCLQVPL